MPTNPNLPIFQDPNQNLMNMQTKWKAAISPVIGNQINQGLLLTGVVLSTSPIPINHLLGRTQIGWIIVDIDAASTLSRTQPFNDKTLTLQATAPCTVSIWVF